VDAAAGFPGCAVHILERLMTTPTSAKRSLDGRGPASLEPTIVEPELSEDESGGLDDRVAGAQVVDRVVDILESFATIGPELGVSDVSRALGLKKATAHRLLSSLLRRGLVAQDAVTRRYRLGIKLWELGSLATSQLDWVDRVKPFLQHLTDVSGETSHLAVLNDGQVLYVEKVESSRSLRMPSQVGKRLPVHCTGVGKALIAFLPEEVLRGVLTRRGMPRMTAHTITDRDVLLAELAEARSRGYAIDNEEIDEGLTCVAAVVRDHTSHVVAAISIAGPSSRLRLETLGERAREVVGTANAMSRALGCPEDILHPIAETAPD
jgi:DNA-binding IclR family transcriptional regulator